VRGVRASQAPRDGWNEIYLTANSLLEVTGSLSRLPRHYGAVLPKMRTPQRGLTIRTLSHNLTYHNSEVDIRWRTIPWTSRSQDNVNILAIPWPFTVRGTDFRACEYPGRGRSGEGFFEYSTDTAIDMERIRDLYSAAMEEVEQVHLVVFPELALTRADLREVQEFLATACGEQPPMIIAGIRSGPARPRRALAEACENDTRGSGSERVNQVALSVYFSGGWYEILQNKHHRWMLDAAQIKQYSLADRLNVQQRWWEAIDVAGRELTILAPNDWLTICPLICEDLAQLEPVSEVIRGVGPTLVIAILMDGPQLAVRWPARYVGVLADDPGTSILTLTSLGMAERCCPVGEKKRRVVALWKDAKSGAEQLELEPGAEAVLLTVNALRSTEFTADGRSDGGTSAYLVRQGLHTLFGRRKRERKQRLTVRSDRGGEADVEELTGLSYFVDAALDASAKARERMRRWILGEPDPPASPRKEPFLHIWQRVRETGPAAAARSGRRGRQVSQDFRTAVELVEGELGKVDEPPRSDAPVREWVGRWKELADTARASLHAAEGRLDTLVARAILWAIHNRLKQLDTLAEKGAAPAELDVRELRKLLLAVQAELHPQPARPSGAGDDLET
jgi:hypothetical protein